MIYRPPRALGSAIGALITLWALLMAILLLVRGLTLDVSFGAFAAYAAAAFFLGLTLVFTYWTYACFNLRYIIDRDGLTICWGAIRQLVPLDKIESLVPGQNLPLPKIEGINWWGLHIGRGQTEEMGDVLYYCTHTVSKNILYLKTPAQTYALSVNNPNRFAQEVQVRRDMGPLRAVPQRIERGGIASHTFWTDRQAQILALAALVTFFTLLGYVFSSYPGLPSSLAL